MQQPSMWISAVLLLVIPLACDGKKFTPKEICGTWSPDPARTTFFKNASLKKWSLSIFENGKFDAQVPSWFLFDTPAWEEVVESGTWELDATARAIRLRFLEPSGATRTVSIEIIDDQEVLILRSVVWHENEEEFLWSRAKE